MTLTGTPGLAQLPDATGWDPRTGPTITRRWRGAQLDVELGAQALKRAGTRYQIDPSLDGGYWMLTAIYGAEETQSPDLPLSDVWSMVGNDLEKELWTRPAIKAELDKIRGQDKEHEAGRLRRLCDAVVAGDEEAPDPPHAGQIVTPTLQAVRDACWFLNGINAAPFIAYIQSRLDGVETWSISQWVLRHTVIVAANSSIRPSLINVGRMYTTEMVRSVEAIPATIMFELPAGYWLKRSPTVEQTASDKFTLSQEYWHADAYDPFVYEIAV